MSIEGKTVQPSIGVSVLSAAPRTFVTDIVLDIGISAVFPPNGFIYPRPFFGTYPTYHGGKRAITYKDIFHYQN